MRVLDGRVALITGAGRGIGREEALYFAGQGARVVVNDPGVDIDGGGGDEGVAAAVVAEIRARGGQAVADTGSVAEPADAERMVRAAVDAFGDLHIVVNNATIERNRALIALDEADFTDVVAVKLTGTFAVSRHAARYWRERHDAGERADRAIVNTASGSGLLNPLPAQSHYAAANAGVAAMTVVHALELARYGVRVNCLSPSMARTRLTENVPGLGGPPAIDGFDPAHPAASAPVAAYLASPRCPLTGQVLSVRGTSVAVNRGWTRAEQVDAAEGPWRVEDLATALEALPLRDPAEDLAAALSGAVGADGHAALQRMIDDALTARA